MAPKAETTTEQTPQETTTTKGSLNMEAPAALLHGILQTVANLVEDVRLSVSDAAIAIKAVDPAHVCMVHIILPATAAVKYAASPFILGVGAKQLAEYLRLAGEKVPCFVTASETGLNARFGGFARRFAAVDVSSLTDPKVPALDYTSSIQVKAGALRAFLKAAGQVSDYVTVHQNPDAQGAPMSFEAPGESDTGLTWNPTSEEMGERPSAANAKGRANYSLDYLQSIVKEAPSDTVVTIQSGADIPARFEWSQDGASIVFLLAPRIDSE